MSFHGQSRIRGGSAKNDIFPNTSTSLPHPTTLINSVISRTKTLSHRSSADDLTPPSKPSGLDQVLKLFHPRKSKLSNAKLRIAPSGAIVFTHVQSQESLGSSILPG